MNPYQQGQSGYPQQYLHNIGFNNAAPQSFGNPMPMPGLPTMGYPAPQPGYSPNAPGYPQVPQGYPQAGYPSQNYPQPNAQPYPNQGYPQPAQRAQMGYPGHSQASVPRSDAGYPQANAGYPQSNQYQGYPQSHSHVQTQQAYTVSSSVPTMPKVR